MSISKFQNVIKGGCGQVVIFGMAAVFIGGLFYQGCGLNSRMGGDPGQGLEIAQVSGVPISADSIQTAMEERMKQFGGMTDALPPTIEIALLGQTLGEAVERANAVGLAKQMNVDVGDAAIRAYFLGQLDKLPERAREELVNAGELKPNATKADFDAVVKRLAQGRTLDQIVADQKADFEKNFADPKKLAALRLSAAKVLVLEAMKKKIAVSDEELRKSFDTLQVKRIVVPFTGATPGGIAPAGAPLDENAARQKAEKALAEVRGGKRFEDAMVQYSGEPALDPKKKVSDNVLPVAAAQLETLPEYAPLRALKPGEVSGVEKTPEGFVVYKVDGVKSDLPKDFEKRKNDYRDSLAARRAETTFQAEIKRYGESNQPRFSSPSYEALYTFSRLGAPASGASPSTPPPTPSEKQLRDVIDLAKRADKGAPDYRIGALVRRAAFDRLYEQAKDKNALADERTETLLASAEAKEDFDARIEVVDAYVGQRKYAQAAEQLAAAARANTTYDATGQSRFSTVSSKLVALKKDGQLPSSAEQQILGEQDRWRSEKKNADEQAAAAAKLAAEDAKRKAEEEKAAKANPKIEDVAPRR